jgi:hypothetical protein
MLLLLKRKMQGKIGYERRYRIGAISIISEVEFQPKRYREQAMKLVELGTFPMGRHSGTICIARKPVARPVCRSKSHLRAIASCSVFGPVFAKPADTHARALLRTFQEALLRASRQRARCAKSPPRSEPAQLTSRPRMQQHCPPHGCLTTRLEFNTPLRCRITADRRRDGTTVAVVTAVKWQGSAMGFSCGAPGSRRSAELRVSQGSHWHDARCGIRRRCRRS